MICTYNKITYDAVVLTNKNCVSCLDIHIYLLFLFVLNAQLYLLFVFPGFFFIFEFQWHEFLVLSHTTIFSRNWWQISFYWQATMHQQIVSHDWCRKFQCAKRFFMTTVYIYSVCDTNISRLYSTHCPSHIFKEFTRIKCLK